MRPKRTVNHGADLTQLPAEVLLYLQEHPHAMKLPRRLERVVDSVRTQNAVAKKAQPTLCSTPLDPAKRLENRRNRRLAERRLHGAARAI